ncbi:shikimate dehydrogenase [Sphingomonas sp. CLY1604]|uniref:shikimate dehydrogenase n=1 Tax=Sphingomonas sp. CLY1604 TaxID=3457786 RepID=UPI003FD8506F
MIDANHVPTRVDIFDHGGIVAGLIGQDIQQSLTPSMHMAEAKAQGLAYVYRLIDLAGEAVGSERLAALVQGAIDLRYDGLNVTHPFKQAVMPHLDAIDPVAEAIGAVNTIHIVAGRTQGFNTDAFGFTAGIKRDIGDISGQSVVQLGAGGAGAATAAAALALGVGHVTIFDTDPSRAEALAQRLAARFEGRASAGRDLIRAIADARGLIHATPTGMAGHPGLPIDPDLLTDALWVAEIVYFPLETELLRVARQRGCRTAHGGTMAVFQAVGAFEIFAGVKADADRMVRHFASLTGGDAA